MKSIIFLIKGVVIIIIQCLGIIMSGLIFMNISGSNFITGIIGTFAGSFLWVALIMRVTKINVVVGQRSGFDEAQKNKVTSKRALEYSRLAFRIGFVLLAVYIFAIIVKIIL